jgi:hypothetical protein
VELNETGKAIQAKADAEKRELTAEEQTEIDAIFAEFEQVENDIKRRERLAAQDERLGASRGRVVPPQNGAPVDEETRRRRSAAACRTRSCARAKTARAGASATSASSARPVRNAAVNPGSMDQRLDPERADHLRRRGRRRGRRLRRAARVALEIERQVMARTRSSRAPISSRSRATRSPSRSTRRPPGRPPAASRRTGTARLGDDAVEAGAEGPDVEAAPPHGARAGDGRAARGRSGARLLRRLKAGEKIAFKVNDAIVNGTASASRSAS